VPQLIIDPAARTAPEAGKPEPIVVNAPQCLLFTSSRVFPRSRKNPGPLVDALHAWLLAGPPAPPLAECWLLGPEA
jgi:hypothetical protein